MRNLRGLIIVVALGLAARAAHADDVSGAAHAFSRAQELTLEGKLGEAADYYELADQLAPSPVALRNAARARFTAGHVAMAATDAAELLRRYPDDATSRSIAEAILSAVTPKVARIDVSCPAGCSVLLDGKAASRKPGDRHVLFVLPGAHAVTAAFADGQHRRQRISAVAGASSSMEIDAPPPLPAARRGDEGAPHAGGISSGWFIAGAALTVVLGGATVYEGLGTLSDRDHIRALTASGDAAAAQQAYDDARGRQTVTNVLIGATAVAGVVTITAAYLAHRSGGESPDRHVTIAPAPGGATIGYAARF